MPAKRLRPLPTTRMIGLLVQAKRELLDSQGFVTEQDFERCWAQAWMVMVAERAWPHATEHRRHWRTAMIATRSEVRAAFLDQPTPFGTLAKALTGAATRLRVELSAEELPQAIIGAIRAGYLQEEAAGQKREVAA